VLKISGHMVLLVVADVMGKGVPAAVFAAILRTMLRDADDKPFHGQAARNRLHKAGDESVRLFEKTHDIPKMHAHRRQFVAAKPFAHRMTNIVEARI
jgi:hypothetical protein